MFGPAVTAMAAHFHLLCTMIVEQHYVLPLYRIYYIHSRQGWMGPANPGCNITAHVGLAQAQGLLKACHHTACDMRRAAQKKQASPQDACHMSHVVR